MAKTEIEKLKEENEGLRLCLDGISAYSKEQHDFSLKIAKDIVKRDSKAVANIILNMRFGNMDNVSFCEIFNLRGAGGCNENEKCTDCIHTFLKKNYATEGVENIGSMNLGTLSSLQGVKEEIDNIEAELKRKGFEEPKGFSTLKGYVEDRIKEVMGDDEK